ncbi:PKD domain-containing protein [Haloarcula litorea]|uniref:PKD domain-containing protein n=1 Tax=Haloarcula litorea TaxID=3032579 RepID=UPI0023E7A0BC|nr:PKD domain-containing protein [Halomicroarcula sp. GDY20]
MDLVGDDRAQSVQIGAVLLFGILIVAFSSYQAFVVPDQNRAVEFDHSQRVQSQMQELRNVVVSSTGESSARSVSVSLGTQYPNRALAVNPGPPSGSLRTVGSTNTAVNVSVRNATAAGETGDYWNETRNYSTGGLAYQPSYNLYTNAPRTVYEQTVLYSEFRSGDITLANQTFIDGNEITLITLNGSLSRSSSGTTSVDVRPVSTSTQTVTIESESDSAPLTLAFASSRPESYWDFLEATEPNVTGVKTDDGAAPDPFYGVQVNLSADQTYRLRMTKVGVGTQVTDENTAYLTDVEGNGTPVSQGETTELVLEVRDRYNNPPANVSDTRVYAHVDAGSLAGDTNDNGTAGKVPDGDGRVRFTYTAPSSATGAKQINVSYAGAAAAEDPALAPGTVQNVTMTVDVQATGGGGGGGAYTVDWQRPPFGTRIANEELRFRIASTPLDEEVGLRSPPFLARVTESGSAIAFTDIDYGVGDSTVVRPTPSDGETNASGYNETGLTWQSDGRSKVYAASGGSSDRTEVTFDRLLNESFEDPEDALVANGWVYNTTAGDGDASVIDGPTNPAPSGSRVAVIKGDASESNRAIELNYSLDTTAYESVTVTYVAREPEGGAAEPEAEENLKLDYYSEADSKWVEVDNVTARDSNDAEPEDHYRRVTIEGVPNATSDGFKIRFRQGQTTGDDPWYIDSVDVVGASEGTVPGSLNQAPVPAFRYSPDSPSAGDSITFDANRSDDPDDADIASYEWDWTSDGTYEATGKDASHVYSTDGTYTVTLRVTDARGASATATQTVTVGSGVGGGGGGGGDFTSTTATAQLPEVGQQRQIFTFTADGRIPAGTAIEFNLDDPQQQSPLQVDYSNLNAIDANVSLSNTNSNTNGDTGFFSITPSTDIADGQTVRVGIQPLRTGGSGQYDVTVTRGDTGNTSTTSFDVARNAGGAEISNFEASDLVADTTGQQQTFTFTLEDSLAGGERINLGLSPAEATGDVSYQGLNSVNVSTSNTNFNKNGGQAWVLIEAPAGGYAAGTSIEIVVNANTDLMTNEPYEIGITRGDAGTTSTTFTQANDPGAIQFSNFQGFSADPAADEFTIDQVQVQDADNDDDLDSIEYVVTDSSGTVVASRTVTGIGPAQYQPAGTPAVTISGTVQEGESYTVTATANDANGNSDSASLTTTAPSSPTVSISSATHDANTGNNDRTHTISVTFTGSDPDGDLASYTVTVYDSSGQGYTVGSETNSYSGGQTTIQLSDTNQGNGQGDDPYFVVVQVEDSTGLTDATNETTVQG